MAENHLINIFNGNAVLWQENRCSTQIQSVIAIQLFAASVLKIGDQKQNTWGKRTNQTQCSIYKQIAIAGRT